MHKWRSSCPDVLLTRLEEIAETRLYLLRQTGPTGFLLKQHDGEAKFKVCCCIPISTRFDIIN